ncbi:Nucleolar protein 12 [Trapelia coarctata]|nr:Nucleolar protein 12 [Trapelia coarctata]
MGKKARPESSKAIGKPERLAQPLSAAPKIVDPTLAALFSSSFNDTKKSPARSSSHPKRASNKAVDEEATSSSEDEYSEDEEERSTVENDSEPGDDESAKFGKNQTKGLQHPATINGGDQARPRKRRHRDGEDDIEGAYMHRIAQEEAKEDAQRHQDRLSKRQKVNGEANAEAQSSDEVCDEQASPEYSSSPRALLSPPPQHETAAADPSSNSSIEQATRTIFLANVSTTAITSKSAYATLTAHLTSHFPSLPASTPPHKLASLRFRSTPYATSSISKKAAFAKKDIMDATTKSTNAYVVYTTASAAREAVKKLNGTIVLNRHLRVDSVAHPAATDHRRCVFVGNLGFVDDESAIRAAEDEENGVKKVRKQKEPADVEEGLWQQFGHAGTVESVRVVRDKTTRVGKGFAYVQFKDPNAVERALLYNSKSFPPLLPRPLRVTRAKNIAKTASYGAKLSSKPANPFRARKEGVYTPKPSSQVQSLSGRAGKLLGRAGAAMLKRDPTTVGERGDRKGSGVINTPESFVFEGYRARGGQKPALGKGKKGGKPKTRSSKRGAAFKASGGKKKRG